MSKGPGVQRMFDAIAGRYDLMNRTMTLGQDQRWRRFVVARAGDPGRGWVLDLATGTGDIAALLRRSYPEASVIGADFSRNMLAEARRRFSDQAIHWQVCDANRLPFADRVFEAVTFGYLLRNVDDSLRVMREVHRVLKPGGTLSSLGVYSSDLTIPLSAFAAGLGDCAAVSKGQHRQCASRLENQSPRNADHGLVSY